MVAPQVAIRIKEYGQQHVYVRGEVRTPGVYALPPDASLLDLLTQANGITPDAGWYVLVIRAERKRVKGKIVAVKHLQGFPGVRIELQKLLAGERVQPVRIRNGDTIYVSRRRHYYAAAGAPTFPGS